MTDANTTEDIEHHEPNEWAIHEREFTTDGREAIEPFQRLISEDMERLANRVERDCEISVSIEVYDLD
jgi:hypothetical protein